MTTTPPPPPNTREAFAAHAADLFADVHANDPDKNIEIETVFPRFPPDVTLVMRQPKGTQKQPVISLGGVTVQRIDDVSSLLVPQRASALVPLSGARIYTNPNVAHLPNLGETVQFAVVKVYMVIVNKTDDGDVLHLFPSVQERRRPAMTEKLSQMYATLAQTNEDLVPNYILHAVRKAGGEPATAKWNLYSEVIDAQLKKAHDEERTLASNRLHVHAFDHRDTFVDVYRRLQYLAKHDASPVRSLPSSFSVDISISDDSHTRLSLHSKRIFETFCQKYKALATPEELAAYVSKTLKANECELMKKYTLDNTALDTLAHDHTYNGFKLNAKREEMLDAKTSQTLLTTFFAPTATHSYRIKQRFSFVCDGFRVDLTMVKQASDKHPTFRPTPFVALEQTRRLTASDTFELEIECVEPSAQPSTDALLYLIDECTNAMFKHVAYFGKHPTFDRYPLRLDTPDTMRVTEAFNRSPCHGNRRDTTNTVSDDVSPNVVNMTHATYDYVRHHWDDYKLLVKTDGLHCLGYVDAAAKRLYLYTQKAKSWMGFALATAPTHDMVLDGEFYTHGGGGASNEPTTDNVSSTDQCTFFVFDVYSKGKQSLLTRTLDERLAQLDDGALVIAPPVALDVRKKLPLRIDQLHAALHNPSDDLRAMYERFECRDASGVKPRDDGFIVMHTGAIVSDDNIDEDAREQLLKTHGTLPYIMTAAEFAKGHSSVNAAARRQQGAYVFCMKWKPEDECTIDFKVRVDDYDTASGDGRRRAQLLCRYSKDDELNLYTVVKALATRREDLRYTPMVPQENNNNAGLGMFGFQPREYYDYELRAPMGRGVNLRCDRATGAVVTLKSEPLKTKPPYDIVEMRYTRDSNEWTPVRIRADKMYPNGYGVGVDNWRNIFDPIPNPTKWTALPVEQYDPSSLRAYYRDHNRLGTTQIDIVHQLLKQHVILKATRSWAKHNTSTGLKVYEVGCGKGTDLFHWNYVHDNVRAVAFYLGTDYDESGLLRGGTGAYHRYLQGGKRTNRSQPTSLTTKYPFDALFVQADASVALSTCSDKPFDASATKQVSRKKLHYQLLRHVLYGKTPDEPELARALQGRFMHAKYHLVSCQMALHYFADPNNAFWKNLRELLTHDGLFVATVPNGDFIAGKLADDLQRKGGKTGRYAVKVKMDDNEREWYTYETTPNVKTADQARAAKHVFFETPKINRSQEPLFRREYMRRVLSSYFDEVYFDTFGAFAHQSKLDAYQHYTDPFNAATIDKRTLKHVLAPHVNKDAKRVDETKAALEYSQDGHYVLVMCRKGAYDKGQRRRLRDGLVG